MKRNMKFLILFLSLAVFASCDKDNEIVPPQADHSEILSNLGENVILKTYEALAANADGLFTATQNLETNPTQQNLDAARTAWVNARSPWEQSEGFLFGPVDQEGLDPSLDSWPVNVTDLNNVLASSDVLTVAYLAQQEGTLKGFHTVEFLLWGANGNKMVGDFTAREFEYLAAAAGAIAQDASTLYQLWAPAHGNYVANIIDAGNGSNIYISQKSALEEMVNSLIVIADEVANGKINDPFSQQDQTLVESQFSRNSKADFADNMRSILNVYTGRYESFGNEEAISDIIRSKNTTLDDAVVAGITAAIDAIDAIPGDFADAIVSHATEVSAAQSAVRSLQNRLEQEVLPIISNL